MSARTHTDTDLKDEKKSGKQHKVARVLLRNSAFWVRKERDVSSLMSENRVFVCSVFITITVYMDTIVFSQMRSYHTLLCLAVICDMLNGPVPLF